jgi:hypothetical protein
MILRLARRFFFGETTFNGLQEMSKPSQFFVVGTACTGLETLYQELTTQLGPSHAGLNEKHIRTVVDCVIRGKIAEDTVFSIYDKAPECFVDKSHPNLWLAEKLLARHPRALMLAIRPPDRNLEAVVKQMTRSAACRKWCAAETFGSLPFLRQITITC